MRGSLSVRGVALRRGPTLVLRAIDFAVQPGEFVTLLGPSGCGKTSLLRLIAGFEFPDAGTVEVSGQNVTLLPAFERPVHTVFQSYALFPHMSVFENVAFGLRLRRKAETEVREKVKEVLDLVRLVGLEGRSVHEISGGQAQRVALARALVLKPDILLLDEPLAALDARLRAEMRHELRAVQKQLGTTFVFVTHDLEEAIELSDRIAVMQKGRIVQFDEPRAIFERPCNEYVARLVGVLNFFLIRNGASAGQEAQPFADLGFAQVQRPAGANPATGLVAFRSEHISLAGNGPTRLKGHVTDARYLGDSVRVHCTLPSGEVLIAESPATTALPAGEVGLWFEDRHAVFLDPEESE